MTQERPGYADTPIIPGSQYRVHDKERPRPRCHPGAANHQPPRRGCAL
ncbi:MAG: hypothetical protein R2867_25440 [Caldilineaceae bacterium]